MNKPSLAGEGMWPLLALEASMFFSLPAWFELTDRAWPASNPGLFFTTVASGAAIALVLCHVVPALCGRMTETALQGAKWWLARFLIGTWFTIGAVLSLSGTARVGGMTLRAYHYVEPDYPWWNLGAVAWVGVSAAAAMAIATSSPGQRRRAGVLCGALGIIVLVGLLIAQSRGLRMTNPRMPEEPDGNPQRTVEAILVVAAPAAVLAFRLGKMGASTTQIWRSGAVGMVIPTVAASTLAATAKVWGARLHWRPSLPIDFTFALAGWAYSPAIQAVCIAVGLTTAGSLVAFATWVDEAMTGWQVTWKRQLGIAVVAGCALSLELLATQWGPAGAYFRPWCWSIVLGSALVGAAGLLMRVGKRLS